MRKHRFRWDSLVFGVFFLAVVGNWAVWKEDILDPRELALSASGVLILLGVLGIAATVWQARPTRPAVPGQPDDADDNPTQTTPEGHEDEEAESQP